MPCMIVVSLEMSDEPKRGKKLPFSPKMYEKSILLCQLKKKISYF